MVIESHNVIACSCAADSFGVSNQRMVTQRSIGFRYWVLNARGDLIQVHMSSIFSGRIGPTYAG